VDRSEAACPHRGGEISRVRALPDQLPTALEVGQSLAALHRALRDFPDALPYLASPLGEVPRWLDALERVGALTLSDLTLLRGGTNAWRQYCARREGQCRRCMCGIAMLA
jgi:hypothetical protein